MTKKKKKERRQNGGGGQSIQNSFPSPLKMTLFWEFTKLCIRTYERGKAPCIKIHTYVFFVWGEAPVRSPKTLQLSELLGGGCKKRVMQRHGAPSLTPK